MLLLTFVTAMILNMGTNFLLGTISFVSNSVTSILQLALSLDYAVILCNRFKEEHRTAPIREAAVVALSKAIPEIGASSLTTVGGLAAMLFMQFRIGPDMGVCLIKAIAFALLSVFVIMPGLLVLFGPWIDKTQHRSFVPDIPFVGKFAYLTRFVIPPLFVVLVVFASRYSGDCPYVYGYDKIETPKLNDTQIAENMIKDNFTSSNLVALVIPTGDYEKERRILTDLDGRAEVVSTMGLVNIEAMDGYMLADLLTPRQFAELVDLDYEPAQTVYTAYAVRQEDYGQIVGGISTAEDWLLFADNCALDAWSRGRTVVLTGDLSLHSVDVAPVPAFGGIFEGGGHSISGLEVTGAVSPGGVFSVVLAGGEIRDLNVVGNVRPSGQGTNTPR